MHIEIVLPTFFREAQTLNILPNQYLSKSGEEPFFIQAIGFAAVGFLVVLLIDRVAFWLKKD